MVWNSLPDDLRAQQDYESFRQGLKPGFSPDTSVLSALETLVITALYKSTFTITITITITIILEMIRVKTEKEIADKQTGFRQ